MHEWHKANLTNLNILLKDIVKCWIGRVEPAMHVGVFGGIVYQKLTCNFFKENMLE